MDFNLTDEQGMLRDTLKRFLADKYSHENRQKLISSGMAYSPELFASLAELGVLGAMFTEEQGGYGGSGFDLSLVFEELGFAGTIEPVLPAVLAGGLLAELGSQDQLAYIDEIIAGSQIAALAHVEAGARYELSHVGTTATVDGNALVLNGTKTHVLSGAQSQLLLVSAREAGGISDTGGISLFLVRVALQGVKCVNQVNIDGTSSATIYLENVRLKKSDRLGAPGEAFAPLERAVARGMTAICAEALGAMEAAKALTLEYLKDRKQFGVSIGKFQALQHRMADMLIEIEQSRSAVINLSGNLHQPHEWRERHVSSTKNLIGRVGAMVSEECIQMHGGIGMTDEYALSHFTRRLIMIDHLFGDADYHLERFISLTAA